jgi:hypothetical protein
MTYYLNKKYFVYRHLLHLPHFLLNKIMILKLNNKSVMKKNKFKMWYWKNLNNQIILNNLKINKKHRIILKIVRKNKKK